MAKEHAIVAGEKYGKYTAIESQVSVLKTGTKVWKWLCKDDNGKEVYKQKADLLDQLTTKELLERHALYTENSVKNNTNQMGIRKRYFDEYRRNSINKEHDFNIDFNYFNQLISSNCHYCGKEPVETGRWKHSEHKKQPKLRHNGIDRVVYLGQWQLEARSPIS